MQKKESKISYKKPTVLAATKGNKNFSASCMGVITLKWSIM